MTAPPRWLWRLMALPVTVSMAVGVLMSIALGPASPFFLALALFGFLPLAARSTTQLGILCLLTGGVQVAVGVLPFLILFAASGGVMMLVGLVAFVSRPVRAPAG
ncbi:hypothetical protein [Crossiella sp. CA198]|uniref:hypothetical protein n=1 Tax=Crossiella sp. CA198 TaxID=3455607 RepID=UPI003F8D71AF